MYVLGGVHGFVFNFEIYTGGATIRLPAEPELRASGSTVVRLCRFLNESSYKLYFDNYYSSIPFAAYLYSRAIETVATLVRNRVRNSSLSPVKVIEKKDRGYYEEFIAQINEAPITIIA